jgi:hypothetical protein
MAEIDEGPYDVLTGHAGARWQWLDVRPEDARLASPVQHTHFALPLDRLLSGERLPYDRAASLAVFGEDLEDTNQAVEELRHRGYRHVLALSGERYGGYAWLVHSRLT